MNTKLFLLLTAFLIAVGATVPSSAQISIKAGVNIASMSESATIDTYEELEKESVTGFQGGFAFDLAPASMFSIQPEVLYIQKGGKTTYAINDDNKIESRYYYNYLEVPVLAKLKFIGEDSPVGFYLIAGPYAGLALGGKVKTTTTVLGQASTSEDEFNFDNEDEDDFQRRMDWGVSFGGGITFRSVYLDLRYNLGINNILDSDIDTEGPEEDPYRRHRGVGIALGVNF